MNKSQLKLASYIKKNKDVTLAGTKRFTDKSGEYYLKNIQLQNSKKLQPVAKRLSLNNPQNLENCLNILKGNLGKIRRRASKIITLLPENSYTPIPMKETKNTTGLANNRVKKELKDAERTAVFIRRMEYATSMKKKIKMGKKISDNLRKLQVIQEWWKTMFKIIKLQKNIRGFLFRKKLMKNLEHQEKLLQFITEFDNIHNYHLYKQFFDALKNKANFEKAKQNERCEDFAEHMDNLDKKYALRRLKNCLDKWKDAAKKKRKEDLENLLNTLANVYDKSKKRNQLNTLNDLKDYYKNKLLDDAFNKWRDLIWQMRERRSTIKRLKKKKERMIDSKKFFNFGEKNDKKPPVDTSQIFDQLQDVDKFLNNRKLKKALDKWKENADRRELLDALKKYQQDKLEKMRDKKNRDVNFFTQKVDDIFFEAQKRNDNQTKKDVLDKLKKLADAANKIEKLDDLILTKQKKNALDKLLNALKKTNDICGAAHALETKINEKLKKKLLTRLKKIHDIAKGADDLEKLLNDKLKRNALQNLKNYAKNLKRGKRKSRRHRLLSKRQKRKLKKLRKYFGDWRRNVFYHPTGRILDKLKNKKKIDDLTDENDDLLKKLKRKHAQILLNIYQRQHRLPLKKCLEKWAKLRNPAPKENFLSNSTVDPNLFQPRVPPGHKRNLYRTMEVDKRNDDISESTSINNSECDMLLVGARKETKSGRNYTSQSFFIDKNLQTKNYEINTHITNKLPMTMKGDFISLIAKTPKILKQKNPRLQVTNATCGLNQIIDEDLGDNENLDSEEIDNEMIKLRYNYNITKNKIISKVIHSCDSDLYSNQNPYKAKKSQWYSVSVPLNENQAKWEFLNNIQGERERTNLNKFELIQHERLNTEIPKTPEKYRIINQNNENENNDTDYKFREINFSQFYRSPIKLNKNYGETTVSSTKNRHPNYEAMYNKYDPRSRFQNRLLKSNLKNKSTNFGNEFEDCGDCRRVNRSVGKRRVIH